MIIIIALTIVIYIHYFHLYYHWFIIDSDIIIISAVMMNIVMIMIFLMARTIYHLKPDIIPFSLLPWPVSLLATAIYISHPLAVAWHCIYVTHLLLSQKPGKIPWSHWLRHENKFGAFSAVDHFNRNEYNKHLLFLDFDDVYLYNCDDLKFHLLLTWVSNNHVV